MLLDFEDLPADASLDCDVCLIGGGIAGLLLTRRLTRLTEASIVLLEGGGSDLEERSQSLYAMENVGLPHDGTTTGRFRVLGGSSTRWGGQLLPLTAYDFERRPHVPWSGWPIALGEIAPYYPGALETMGVNDLPFDAGFVASADAIVPSFDPAKLRPRFSKWAPFGKRNLARTVGGEIAASGRVRCYRHANVVALEPGSDHARIERARVAGYGRAAATIRAKTYVICAGGLESARILLLGDGRRSATGDGDGAVGRFFQDHLSVRAAVVEPRDRREILSVFEAYLRGGTQHTIRIEATPEIQAREGILNVLAHVVFETAEDSGFDVLRRGLRSLQEGEAARPSLAGMLGAVPEASRLAWSAAVRRRRAAPSGSTICLRIDLEQAPNPESRVTLSEERDALGLRKGRLDWRLTSLEGKTVRVFAALVDEQWRRLGLGTLAWLPGVREGADAWVRHMTDAFHHMGATRMGDDPASSVVDRDLKVHGLENLYVASSSVFPTSGSSNPTLTLMALCLRLADHLARSPRSS